MIINDVRKIERVSLNYKDDIESQLRGEVLGKAYEAFGYKADSFGSRGPLAKVLSELDIKPLNSQQVEAYKKSKERRFSFDWNIVAGIVSLIVLVAIWAVPLHFWTFDKIGESFLAMFPMMMSSAFLIIHAAGTCLVFQAYPKYISIRHWEKYSLGGEGNKYERYVPVHVLNWAVQIKDGLPNTRFNIHELTITNGNVWPQPDPFLVASYGSEKYYIAVWDEREFEAKL